MNRTHTQTTQHTDQNNTTLIFIFWNIRAQGSRQGRKKRKIKNEIEVFNIIIPTETHLSKQDKEIIIMGKYLQKYNNFHVYNRNNTRGQKGVTIRVKKYRVNIEKVDAASDKGREEEGRQIGLRLKIILDKPLNTWGVYTTTIVR